ncbi:MAG: Fic family protein [Gemmatimonadaceae bacterium]
MTGTRKNIRQELDFLLGIIAQHPAGLSAGELADRLRTSHGIALEPYAVNYRLKKAPPTSVLTEGRGRGTKYLPGPDLPRPSESGPTPKPDPKTPHWLSQEGAEAIARIRQPRGVRKYVGYNRAWLENYAPNVEGSAYLPRSARAHLLQLGRTPEERPAGTFAREILSRLLIDLSWASSRLEGNTYSRIDTQKLIEFGQRAEGKDATEAQMILNHKAAIEYLVDGRAEAGITAHTIRSLHGALSEGLLADARDEGRLRQRPVSITGTTYVPTEDPHLIAECFERIVNVANAIADPFERSFFLLVHLPYLQPFADVNKRTARLTANIPLIDANLCPLTFVDVAEDEYVHATLAVYELSRVEPMRDLYIYAYERSAQLYSVAREAATPPHPLQLRYRAEMRHAIADTVRKSLAPTAVNVESWAREHGIDEPDVPVFAELTATTLRNLNDASATRYGLLPSEFDAWSRKFPSR